MSKSGVRSSGLTLRCGCVVRVADRGKDRRHGSELHSSDQFAKFGGLSHKLFKPIRSRSKFDDAKKGLLLAA